MRTTRIGAFVVVTAALVALADLKLGSEAKEESRAILEAVQKYGNCVVQSTFSFLYSSSYPPKSVAEQRQLCRSQTEGFKCVKERTKGSPAILRRGLLSFVSGRQRHHRKYCANLESEQSRRFLAATRCVMEKKFDKYHENDAELVQTLEEIARRNYNDSAVELKRICCAFHAFKKTFAANIEPECVEHKAILEELGGAIAAEELSLVCEDEEKLAKLCPTLEPLKFKRVQNYAPQQGASSAGLALYLIATLGEPNEESALH